VLKPCRVEAAGDKKSAARARLHEN
jgi:hypothetical protein